MKRYIIFLLFIFLLLAISYKLSLSGERIILSSILLIGILFLFIYLITNKNHIRSLLFFFVFATLCEGVLKLKTTGILNIIAYVGRDILLYSVVLGIVMKVFVLKSISIPKEKPPLLNAIILFVIVCFVQVFNPLAISFFNGFINLRNHIEMIPLFFFGFYGMRNIRRLRIFFGLMVMFAIINSLVAVYQHQIGVEGMIKWGEGYKRMYTSLTDARLWVDNKGISHIRPPALGSDMGYATGIIQISAPLCITLLAIYMRKGKKYLFFMIVAICVMVLGAFVSGIRSLIMLSIIGVIITLLLQLKIKNTIFIIILVILVSIGGGIGLQLTSETLGEGIYDRYEDLISPVTAFSTHRGGSFILLFDYIWKYPLGRGIGLVGPAAGRFSEERITEFTNAETYFNFMISEVGLPGLILITFITISIIVKGYKMYNKLQDKELSWYVSAQLGISIALFIGWFGTPMLVSYPFNAVFWFIGGMLLSMNKLESNSHQVGNQ